MSTVPLGIEFVTRKGCQLCDEALPTVRSVASSLGVPVNLRDVDEDPALADFTERVPVVLSASGQVLAEGEISSVGLWFRLAMGRLTGW